MAGKQRNCSVVPDTDNNRLYFTIAGKVTKKELDKLYTDVRFCVADLNPDYNIISDLSQCKLACLNVIPTFRKIMNYLITNGAGEMVGVLPGNNLVHRQIINLGSRFRGYKPIFALTLEDAEAKLKNSTNRNGLRFNLPHLQVDCMIGDMKVKGQILNISISGCAAVIPSTLQAYAGEKILIIVTFAKQDTSLDVFKINARVVRVETDTLAVEFMDLDKDRKEQLWNYLVSESKYHI